MTGNEVNNMCNDAPCKYNFTDPVKYKFPYVPTGRDLETNSISLDVKHDYYTEKDMHSLYAFMQAKAMDLGFENMQNRTYLITTSSFAGTGQFSSHSLGENNSTFKSLKKSVTGIMLSNMFGMPLSGAPICGYNGNTTAELCARWHYLGAFQPLSWNHNSKDASD